jgi:predicted nucleic acid-binding protein
MNGNRSQNASDLYLHFVGLPLTAASLLEERCAEKRFMATVDADACVVDTNVLIYSTVAGNAGHQPARERLSALQEDGVRLCITTQILREHLVVLTRGTVFERSFSVDQVLAQIEAFLPALTVLDESVTATDCLRELVRRYSIRGKQIHDANIVAVMLTHGIQRLVTYNQSDFARFDEIHLEPIAVQDTADP